MKAWRAKRTRQQRQLQDSVVKMRAKIVQQQRELEELKV